MRMKKWLSTFLVAVLLLNIVFSVDVSAETSTDPVVVTKYVSASGSDETGDGTAESPYATLQKAEEVLEADGTADEGKIIISGSITFTAATHTKMMTITGDGNSGTELSLAADSYPVRIYGPTTMEYITLKTPDTYVNNGLLKTYTDELILGKGVVVSGSTHAYFRVGNLDWEAGNADGTGDTPALTIDEISHSGSAKNIQLRIGTGGGAWMNGANITINGGKVEDINFHRATQFSKNVNLVINGGTIGTIRKQTADSFTGTYKFHKALQIIFNNGSRDNVTDFDKASIDGIEDVGGKWYMYGGTGGSLSTTETAGTFKVNGTNYAKIVSMSDSTIYCGEPGQTVTVPAGEYTVTYSADRPSGTLNEVTKYVSATGDDTNGDGTQENPYKTVEKAEEVLQADSTADMGRIILSGSVSFAAAAHTKMITITGDGAEGTQLSLDGLKRILGPTTIENVTLYNNTNGQSLTTQGQQLVFGEGVTVKYDTYKVLTLLAGDGWQGVTSGRATMEINSFSGLAPVVQVGSVQITSPVTLTGADIVLNGGTLNQINLCPTGKGITYTENVNVTVNGGNPGFIQVNQPATFQKALQIVLNNGVSASKIDANVTTNATIAGGKWIMCGDTTAGSLSTTETAGTFTVNGEKYAQATLKSDTTKVYYGNPGETLVVPEGEYDVTYLAKKPGGGVNVVTKYVSATGSDTTGDGTQANPYATISKAEEVLEANEAADEGKIILSGSVTFSAAAHTKMMTITSDGDASTKLSLEKLSRILGPTTVESLTIYNGTNSQSLATQGQTLVFGEGVTVQYDTYKVMTIIAGDGWQGVSSGRPTMEINSVSGLAPVVQVGAASISAPVEVPGADVVLNGGTLNQINLCPTGVGITYTKDVNVTVNGGDPGWIQVYKPATFAGALQIVLNNGVSASKIDANVATNATVAGGKWIMCGDKTGGSLSTTDTAGTFKVNGDKYAKATLKSDSTKVYLGNPGDTLVVPEGEYNVTFLDRTPDVVYVSKSGDDANSGKTSAMPVKTLAKAFALTGDGATVIVLDEATYDVKELHGKKTLKGNTADAVVKFGADENAMKLQGNLVVKDIVLQNQNDNGAIYTYNYSLYIGENVSYQGTAGAANPLVITGDGTDIRKLTIDKADFAAGNLLIDKGSYSVVTEKGKTPVAATNEGKRILTANEAGVVNTEVSLKETAKTDYSNYISYRKGLPNTFKKLNNGEKINVVYFGGSVTVGTGAGGSWGNVISTDKETSSWRALISKWLETKYPNQVNNMNDGLGESGTYMGSFRINRILEKHVNAGETPDLFFIEYSINDYYALNKNTESVRYDSASSQFETIVREIKKVNPNCDIVTVLVADSATMAGAKTGNLHVEAKAHDDVSKAYNIPSLKFGSAIANKVANLEYANDTWKQYFTDIVHPTSAGYQEYYKCIEEFMINSLQRADYVETEFPDLAVTVQSKTLFDGNRTVMDMTQALFDQSTGSGFTLDTTAKRYEFNGSITAANAGSTFTYSFTGTETAILTNQWYATDFTVEVDGTAYTPSAGSLAHNPITLAKGLEPGKHTVKITTVKDSTVIYAIFTHDASAVSVQGSGVETKKATFELPVGSYFIRYYENATVGDVNKPVIDGLTVHGWLDEQGKLFADSTPLSPGMELIAYFWTTGKTIHSDVNGDGYVNAADIQKLREILVGKSDVAVFDVNGDGNCDAKDLVAIKKFLANKW